MKFKKVIFLFLISFIIGCAGMQTAKETNSASLEPQSILKFSDVPVPVGMKNLPQQSYSFQSSGVRVGVLKYQGKADTERILSFYREQMPIYNWSLVNIVEYGQRLMNFERENESCIISIEPKGSTVLLTLSLGPKSQNFTKKAKTPIK